MLTGIGHPYQASLVHFQNSYYSSKGRDHKKEQSNRQVYSPNENALSARSNEPMGLLNSFAAIGKNVW